MKTAYLTFSQKYMLLIYLEPTDLTDLIYFVFQMDKIFNLLQMFRLEKYYKKFIDLGIEEELDFFDSVNDKTLKDMSMSFILKFLFSLLKSVLLPSIILISHIHNACLYTRWCQQGPFYL